MKTILIIFLLSGLGFSSPKFFNLNIPIVEKNLLLNLNILESSNFSILKTTNPSVIAYQSNKPSMTFLIEIHKTKLDYKFFKVNIDEEYIYNNSVLNKNNWVFFKRKSHPYMSATTLQPYINNKGRFICKIAIHCDNKEQLTIFTKKISELTISNYKEIEPIKEPIKRVKRGTRGR